MKLKTVHAIQFKKGQPKPELYEAMTLDMESYEKILKMVNSGMVPLTNIYSELVSLSEVKAKLLGILYII